MIFPWKNLFTLFFVLPLFACGGGGGGDGDGGGEPAPAAVSQQVDLTVGLHGSGTIGAVDMEVMLPAGFLLETDTDGHPKRFTVLIEGGTIAVNYTPENQQTNGFLKIGIIKVDGFAANADLIKISKIYNAGAVLPKEGDFVYSMEAFDLNGASIVTTPRITLTNKPAP